jgi:hypothetical protein
MLLRMAAQVEASMNKSRDRKIENATGRRRADPAGVC